MLHAASYYCTEYTKMPLLRRGDILRESSRKLCGLLAIFSENKFIPNPDLNPKPNTNRKDTFMENSEIGADFSKKIKLSS